MSLEFTDAHGRVLPIITHSHEMFASVPLEVKEQFQRAPRPAGAELRGNAKALHEMHTVFFGASVVLSVEALGSLWYHETGEVLTKKDLLKAINKLVASGAYERMSRGYYRLRTVEAGPFATNGAADPSEPQDANDEEAPKRAKKKAA